MPQLTLLTTKAGIRIAATLVISNHMRIPPAAALAEVQARHLLLLLPAASEWRRRRFY
jgi:hypothetical protein